MENEMAGGIRIKVVGAGGIGTHLFDALCMYLSHGDFPSVEVSIIDGDTYEHRNRERQIFDEIGPKATVTAERLKEMYPDIMFFDHPDYVDEDNVVRFIREDDVVFICVDNHISRKFISDRAEELDNVTVICGSNDIEDGNVIVHVRRDGENLTLPVSKHMDDMADPDPELHPSKVEESQGCEAQVAAEPQLVVTNNAVAALMLNAFYGTLKKQWTNELFGYSFVYHNVVKNNTRCEKFTKMKITRRQANEGEK
jgi:molybdopterin/thiamine biosynthesis adenylyltransferase